MRENFEEFWDSELSVPVETIFDDGCALVSPADVHDGRNCCMRTLQTRTNFEPQVGTRLISASDYFPDSMQSDALGRRRVS